MEIIKGNIVNNFIKDKELESNDYIKYYLLKDDKIIQYYGKIVKKLTRNLYIVNDLETKENCRINKNNILNKIERIENKADINNKMKLFENEEANNSALKFFLIGFLILIGIGLSIFSFVSLELTIQKFINKLNISMFGLDDWMKKIKYN